MSFVLHRADRADALVEALADIMAPRPADPFAPEVVAVHSRGVERWLTNRLSARLGASAGRTDGVCANLLFPFPGRLVSDALASATGVSPSADPWRPERLAWPLLEVVDRSLAEPWLQVLAGHLGGPEAVDHADRDRRFAAVRHLADLFDRYAVHRPDMVRAWLAGDDTDGSGGPLPADAAWQAQLWRELRSVVGSPSQAERLVEGVERLVEDPSLVELPERLSLFGMTRLPASYLHVLRALAVHRDVHLLALHPSAAAWDATVVDHPLLAAWGRDSREMQVVLEEIPDLVDASTPPPIEGPPTTLLAALQADVRANARPSPHGVLDPADRSVQVHACHGPARQAEVVRDAIAHLLVADPTIEPRDVVVLCPDIEELAPLLNAAFADARSPLDVAGGGPPAIPYRLADRSLRQTNPMLGALAEVLVLADGRLTASQVLALAALEPVRERFGFDDDDLARIAGWVAETGTRWGLDAAHRAPFDLATVEAGTWRTGLIRILLGVAMTEDRQRLVGGALPLDDVDAGDIDLAGRLAELVTRLGGVVRDLSSGPRSMAAWVASLRHAADLLLHARSSGSWQRHQVETLLAEVGEQAAGSACTLRLAEVRDLLGDRLRGQPSRAAFRTGDLTLCTLVPMRSVPHRVVCVVGLDDGAFPRGTAPDGDDLLVRQRRPGDHDRRSEDRQLLLDAVLSATDALVITYSGRDPRTNERLPPSVPVHELLDVLDATMSTADGRRVRDHLEVQHPLQPNDPRAFDVAAPSGPWGFDPAMLRAAEATQSPKANPEPFLRTRLAPLVEEVISLEDLIGFVQHPVRAFLRQRLGISLREDDDLPQDGLALELDGLGAWGVGNRMLQALLVGGNVDDVVAAEQARGLLPPGALGVQVLQTAKQKAEGIAQAAGVALGAAHGSPMSLEVDVLLLDGRRLVGVVPDVVGDVLTATTYSTIKAKQRLQAWVRLLAATAAHPDRPLRSVTVGGAKGAPRTVTYGPLAASADERRSRALDLLAVLADLRDRGLREPLPLPIETSRRYADTYGGTGDEDEALSETAGYWTSTYDWSKEDAEAEHVLAFGAKQPFAWLRALAPEGDEADWRPRQRTRFGALALRLWDPVLRAERAGRR